MSFKYLNLRPGDSLRLSVDSAASLTLHGLVAACSLKGEILLEVLGFEGEDVLVGLRRMGLYGKGPASVGRFSFRGQGGGGILKDNSISVEMRAGVVYDALAKAQRPKPPNRDHFRARREEFAGALSGTFKYAFSGKSQSGFVAQDLRIDLNLDPKAAELGMIRRLVTELFESPFFQGRAKNSKCHDDNGRSIKLQLVRIRENKDDPRPTGSHWSEQLTAAREIWGKCCIEIVEVLPSATVDDLELKYSDAPADVMETDLYEPIQGVIPIFFVASDFGLGGGYTDPDGSASVATVLTEYCEDNPNLLAHELGHVFDGDHPDADPSTTENDWIGDVCTVLKPTNSLSEKNPELNTLHNCEEAWNDAMTHTGYCCMKPDEPTTDC